MIDLGGGPVEIRAAVDMLRFVWVFQVGDTRLELPYEPVKTNDLHAYRQRLRTLLNHAFRASWARPGEPWPDCLAPMFAEVPEALGEPAPADPANDTYEPPGWIDELPPMFPARKAAAA